MPLLQGWYSSLKKGHAPKRWGVNIIKNILNLQSLVCDIFILVMLLNLFGGGVCDILIYVYIYLYLYIYIYI